MGILINNLKILKIIIDIQILLRQVIQKKKIQLMDILIVELKQWLIQIKQEIYKWINGNNNRKLENNRKEN